MAELQLHKGEFFINDKPDIRHNGVLTINDDNSGELELFGSFDKPSPAVDGSTYTIWGQLFDGRAVSLLDSGRRQQNHTLDVAVTERWGMNIIVLGTLIEDRRTPAFNSVSFDIERLREWIGIDGGTLDFNHNASIFSYSYTEPDKISFHLSADICGAIYFKNELWINLEYKNQAEQKTRVSLESSQIYSLDDWTKQIRHIRKLISLFVGQKLKFGRIVVTGPDKPMPLIKPMRVMPEFQAADVIFHDNERYGAPAKYPIYMVRFLDISEAWDTIMQNWQTLLDSNLSPVTDILIDALTDHYFYDENEFLRVWQAVEAFHRIVIQDTAKLKNDFQEWFGQIDKFITDETLLLKVKSRFGNNYETSARNRIKEIWSTYREYLQLNTTDKMVKDWVTEIIDTRNYLTHMDPESVSRKALPQHIYNYTGLLKALLVVMLLKKLGLNDELLKKAVSHQVFNLRQLMKQ